MTIQGCDDIFSRVKNIVTSITDARHVLPVAKDGFEVILVGKVVFICIYIKRVDSESASSYASDIAFRVRNKLAAEGLPETVMCSISDGNKTFEYKV